ncbi:MAG: ABC transporter ATP-binding protein [Alphaproteobacteria bacterium]|nr:ABC transporter ATP-binding protein [Alphaproteobacteria bacterium]
MTSMNTSFARVEVAGLRFRYPGGFTLGPVSLSLGPGLHLLEGENGAGKTTLMRCLCGALRPQEGRVEVAGGDPGRSPEVRGRVAWLTAHGDLPEFFTVEEAWQTLASLRRAPSWDGAPLCEALGLPPRLRLAAASAGQRRKAELVAALAGEPPVLLLDEPFANLDARAGDTVRAWLEAWRAERVVLVSTHEGLGLTPDSQARLAAGAPLRWSGPA